VKKRVQKVCRSAKTGRFAPLRMAKCYPARYVVERVKRTCTG
jgi:hypothetical protein